MELRLKGIHRVKKRLADGSLRVYHYAWRGGPQMKEKPDTLAFAEEFYALTKGHERERTRTGTFAKLVEKYRASEAYKARRPATRSVYDWAIKRILSRYADLPIEALSETGMRSEILEWRDRELADKPRAADLIITCFATILSFAKDREIIERNPLEEVRKINQSSRRDIIWTDEQLDAFRAKAPPMMVLALELALWTGQRQGDLLRLTWSAYDGNYITLKQEKTGSFVRVKVAGELKARLDATKRRSVTILTNRSGRPFSEGFRSSWAKACEAAGIEGVTFHDLRGTFISLAHRAGASIREISEVSGHTEKDAERIIRRHYLKADSAVSKLEMGTKAGQKL